MGTKGTTMIAGYFFGSKKRNGPSDVYDKDGGKDQKKKDFDKLNKGEIREEVTDKGTIRFGQTQNGETIVDRDFSGTRSQDKPTLEIQYGQNDYLKIRYKNQQGN